MLFLLLILGLAPSLIWLALYLRQDAHPEPKRLVLRVFFVGAAVALLAAFAESFFLCSLFSKYICSPGESGFAPDLFPSFTLDPSSVPGLFFGEFIGIAFIEETVKLLAVRIAVLRDKDFDEPVDAMIYLIIAALGFATVENVLIMLGGTIRAMPVDDILSVAIFRFLGATLLHTTAAGITGYFLSRSFFPGEPRRALLMTGLFLAAVSHWLYNSFIGQLEISAAADPAVNREAFINLFLLLSLTAVIIFALLKHLRAISFRHKFRALIAT